MKITVTSPGITPVILGDDSKGDYIDGFLPGQSRQVQRTPLFRATYVRQFDRGNRLNEISFTVERVHKSQSDAFSFLLTHAESVPNTGSVEFSHAGTRRFLKEAMIAEARCVFHKGVTTIFQYSISGGQITTS